MKKRLQVHRWNSPPVKLYLADLRELVAVFSKARPEFEIAADDYEELDDLTQLQAFNRARIQTFRLVSKDRSAVLSLGPRQVDLFVSGDSLVDVGLVAALQKCLLDHRQGLLDGRYNELLCWAILYAVSLGLWVLLATRHSYFTLAGAILVAVCATVLPWLGYVAGHRVKVPHSLLLTTEKSDTPSFWSRNSDKILVDLIKVLVGALIGGVAGYFLTRK